MKFITALVLMLSGVLSLNAEIKHTFVCVENGKRPNLVYVDQFEPSNSWKIELPKGSRDVFLIDSDKVLVSEGADVKIRSLKDGSILQTIKAPRGNQTASLTSDGNILMASGTEIVVASQEGKIIRKNSITKVAHNRLARQLKNGNVMYGVDYYKYHEYDQEGKLVWNHKFKEKTYLIHEKENGDFLATTGHGVLFRSI